MSNLSLQMKRNVFHYRTGTLFNQKHAVRLKSPLASSVHFANNQTVLFIFSQGVNKISSLA